MKNKFSSLRPGIIKGMLSKEFTQLFRDKRMKIVIFVAPVIMLLVFGYAVNTDVVNVKIAVLDSDRSLQSRMLIEKVTSSGHFTLNKYIESINAGEEYIQSGEVEAVIRIPDSFATSISKGQTAKIQILLDGTDPNRALIINAYISTIIKSFSNDSAVSAGRIAANEPVTLENRTFFNETLESRVFFLPAILGLLGAVIITMLTSMSIVKERETGTIEQIIVSPIRSIEFIAGKVIPFGIVSMVDILVISLIIITWFKVPMAGSLLLLLICGFIFTIASIGIGIFISTVSSTQQQAMLSTFLYLLPALLLSGFIFPISSMPEPVALVTYLNPMRYFIEIVRDIFLKGVGIFYIWEQMLALLLLGTGFIVLSIRRFNKGFE